MKMSVGCVSGKNTVVVSKEEIAKILFPKGRMLLLDRVAITDGFAIGEFTVPIENCEGHEPIPNMPVMRGVEIPEMAFQLLGVFLSHDPGLFNMLKGKVCVAREITSAKFRGFICPGDKLILETATDIDVNKVAGTLRIESNRIIARVGGEKKCIISSVAIVAFNPDSIKAV